MLRRYSVWLWAAVVLQILTAAFHTIGIFLQPEPIDDTQRQLLHLMQTYRLDAGAGFKPSMSNLFTALSSCFTFVCLLGGLINAYLLRQNAAIKIISGVVLINLAVFGAVFLVMLFLTFLPPIVCTGLIFVCLFFAFILAKNDLVIETQKSET